MNCVFCPNCGNELGPEDQFCGNCGKRCSFAPIPKCSEHNHTPQEPYNLHCPYCGSTDCHSVVKTEVSGGGFSASNGCCGFLLLGPLGLLCGACGSEVKSSSETWWNCKMCGKEFMTPEATREKLKTGVKSAALSSIICAFLVALFLAMDEGKILCVIPAAVAAFLWYSVAQIPQQCANTPLEDFIDADLYKSITSKYIWIGAGAFLILSLLIKQLLWS